MWVSQIAGVTSVPAGSVRPSTDELLGEAAAGERDHRAQAQRLGDRRPQVVVLARRRASRAGAAARSGWRSSRSKVQASAVAVVSWPASSSVISWSRSSVSLIAPPSSNAASISIERMSSRSSRSGLRAVLGDLGVEQLVDLAAAAPRTAPSGVAAAEAARGEARSAASAARRSRPETVRACRAGAPAAARRRRRRRPAGSPPA